MTRSCSNDSHETTWAALQRIEREERRPLGEVPEDRGGLSEPRARVELEHRRLAQRVDRRERAVSVSPAKMSTGTRSYSRPSRPSNSRTLKQFPEAA